MKNTNTNRPAIGDLVTVRGLACRITAILPAGTIEVVTTDGTERAFRVSGLSASADESDRRGAKQVKPPSWLGCNRVVEDAPRRNDTGRYEGGYRVFRDGSMREDFGGDR